MKTLKTITTALILVLITSVAFAQSEATGGDYFAGKWEVFVEGTPQGDVTMIFNLSREEGELVGNISAEGESDTTKIDRITENDDSITAYWFAQGYNVNITLKKKDENSMTGSLMNMFNSSAERIQE